MIWYLATLFWPKLVNMSGTPQRDICIISFVLLSIFFVTGTLAISWKFLKQKQKQKQKNKKKEKNTLLLSLP